MPLFLPKTNRKLTGEADFEINSSALHRAFPDFSQYGSSEEDSIEIGRGLNHSYKDRLKDVSEDVTRDYPFSLHDEHFQITGTPPFDKRMSMDLSGKRSTTKKEQYGKRLSSHKENLDPLAKFTDYVSGNSSKGSHNPRQPRVDSDDSQSLIVNRPALVNHSIKSTRFSNSKIKDDSKVLQNNKYESSLAENKKLRQSQANTDQPQHTPVAASQASVGNATNQSFLLPDMPDITALMTGIRGDATPVFPRSAKSKSRFAMPPQQRKTEKRKPSSHAALNNVPAVAEDRALYLSLQLLQEKVLRLESENANSEKKIEGYEAEVSDLQSKIAELEMLRHHDSGLGSDEDEQAKEWSSERASKPRSPDLSLCCTNRCLPGLELSVKSLQGRLERANQKLSQSEKTAGNITKDRDVAQKQLASAQLDHRELKVESQALRNEIELVKSQMMDINKRHEHTIDRLTTQETELRQKIHRREKAVKEMGQLSRELWTTRIALLERDVVDDGDARPAQSVQTQYLKPATTHEQSSRQISSASSLLAPPLSTALGRTSSSMTQVHYSAVQPESQAREEYISGYDVDLMTERRRDIPLQPHIAFQIDSTNLSFMDGDEIPKLRKIVDEEKKRLGNASNVASTSYASRDTGFHETNSPRKSSLKTLSTLPSRSRGPYEANTSTHDSTKAVEAAIGSHEHDISPAKQDTQQSVASRNSERRRRNRTDNIENMTSAFIIPDVTRPAVESKAQKGDGSPSQVSEGVKHTITIQRPIPVSDRQQVSVPGEEEPTMRPAQTPGVALAVVLRGLEGELYTLHKELAHQEKLYRKHDPALRKRKRKSVYAKSQELLRAIETRADQIYALYDVLEGQKLSGHVMEEAEIEVTLQNIGVSCTGGQLCEDNESRERGSEHGSDDESELEQTWDGIEATHTQTLDPSRDLRLMTN